MIKGAKKSAGETRGARLITESNIKVIFFLNQTHQFFKIIADGKIPDRNKAIIF